MQQSKNGRRVGRVGVISALLPNNGQSWRETNGKTLSISLAALGEKKMHPVLQNLSDLSYRTHRPDNK